MLLSGRTVALSNECGVKGVPQALEDDIHTLLDERYKTTVLRFGELHKKYETELKKAANQRRKSSYPSFKEWTPIGRDCEDLKLIKGPDKHVTVYSKTMKQERTGRLIVYSPEKDGVRYLLGTVLNCIELD